VTLVANGLAVWRRLYFERQITEKDSATITEGMTEFEVRWRLGAPKYEQRPMPKFPNKFWLGYDIPPNLGLDLRFRDGKVEYVLRTRFAGGLGG
jgi:hypothetical protein